MNNINQVFYKNKLIGYVMKVAENDYTISTSTNKNDWAGKFETKKEAIDYLINRYKIIKWK